MSRGSANIKGPHSTAKCNSREESRSRLAEGMTEADPDRALFPPDRGGGGNGGRAEPD